MTVPHRKHFKNADAKSVTLASLILGVLIGAAGVDRVDRLLNAIDRYLTARESVGRSRSRRAAAAAIETQVRLEIGEAWTDQDGTDRLLLAAWLGFDASAQRAAWASLRAQIDTSGGPSEHRSRTMAAVGDVLSATADIVGRASAAILGEELTNPDRAFLVADLEHQNAAIISAPSPEVAAARHRGLFLGERVVVAPVAIGDDLEIDAEVGLDCEEDAITMLEGETIYDDRGAVVFAAGHGYGLSYDTPDGRRHVLLSLCNGCTPGLPPEALAAILDHSRPTPADDISPG